MEEKTKFSITIELPTSENLVPVECVAKKIGVGAVAIIIFIPETGLSLTDRNEMVAAHIVEFKRQIAELEKLLADSAGEPEQRKIILQ